MDEDNIVLISRPPVGTRWVDIKLPSPIDGKVRSTIIRYDPVFFNKKETNWYLAGLLEYAEDGEIAKGNMYGVEWTSSRRSIQIADPGVPAYRYPGSASKTNPFTDYPIVESLRQLIFDRTGNWFNFCLYNCYPIDSKLGWHPDSEKNMLKRSPIYSMSFGLRRRFRVRRIDNHKDVVFDELLESGSLLTMEGDCQDTMEHCVWPLTEKQMEAISAAGGGERINLTFRKMHYTNGE